MRLGNPSMASLREMISLQEIWEERRRVPVLVVSGAVVALIAVTDWWTRPYVSLGFLYLFPIMLAAGFLSRWVIVLLGVGCAWLSELFSSLEPSALRLTFEALALVGCGLFLAELVRNRRLALGAQERLRILVETSPAAIVTIDERGFIQLANRAAVQLLDPRDGQMLGTPIAAFLPELHHAIRWEEAPQFRASMQCRCHRGSGESFIADVWFSTYKEDGRPRVAAIIADVSDETGPEERATDEPPRHPPLTRRELDLLRFLVQGMANKEIAAEMELSEGTVKNTLQQLFARTGVRTRAQLVRVALEEYRDLL